MGGEGLLYNATSVDECFSCCGIDVQSVFEVVHKGLVHGMKWAQLPVRRNDNWLHSGMRA